MILPSAYDLYALPFFPEAPMEIRKPAYYDTFRCIASDCPDSCCKEWAVQVDDEAAARYRELPGELGEHLRSVMVEEDGDTILKLTKDRRCPMWRDDGLCRIQAQLGEEALCRTCHQFPRLRHDYGDFVELGLELSCPEAARLILEDNSDILVEAVPGGEAPEYDEEAMAILLKSRGTALSLINSKQLSVGDTLAVLLVYGYAVQEELDGGEAAILEASNMLKAAKSIASNGNLEAILDFYRSLEILTPQWLRRLQAASASPLNEALRPLVKYFIHRYWLQAVSDYDLVGRVKLTVVSCLVIQSLGGDLAESAQLYSKEIENDADNIDAILDGAYTSPALADIGLLDLLLEE